MPDGCHDLASEGEPELGVRLQPGLVGGKCRETSHQSSQGQHTGAKSHSYLLSGTVWLIYGVNNGL